MESLAWFEKVKSTLHEYSECESLSSDEFIFRFSERAEYLTKKFKLESGHAVLLLKSNTIDFLIDLFAIWKTGACAIPFPSYSTEMEISTVTKFSRVSLVIFENGKEIYSPQEIDYEYWGLAIVLFTSGTTGEPKGAKISHQALERKLKVLSRHVALNEIENSFCALPCFFGHGLICNTLFPIMYGNNFTIVKSFDLTFVSDLEKFIHNKSINFFSTVPSVWNLIINFCPPLKASPLRRIHCASSPLLKENVEEILKWANGIALFDVYGITEMLGWIGCRKIENTESILSFGDFWEIQRKLDNEELQLRADYMFSGYLKRPDLTSNAFNGNYFKTGDLFDGPRLKGRTKEVIIKSGIKIFLNEIDSLLMSSKLLKDVCSFGVSDSFSGERLGVALVLKEKTTLKEVKDFLGIALPNLKHPDHYLVLSEIYRNARGKLNRDCFSKMVSAHES